MRSQDTPESFTQTTLKKRTQDGTHTIADIFMKYLVIETDQYDADLAELTRESYFPMIEGKREKSINYFIDAMLIYLNDEQLHRLNTKLIKMEFDRLKGDAFRKSTLTTYFLQAEIKRHQYKYNTKFPAVLLLHTIKNILPNFRQHNPRTSLNTQDEEAKQITKFVVFNLLKHLSIKDDDIPDISTMDREQIKAIYLAYQERQHSQQEQLCAGFNQAYILFSKHYQRYIESLEVEIERWTVLESIGTDNDRLITIQDVAEFKRQYEQGKALHYNHNSNSFGSNEGKQNNQKRFRSSRQTTDLFASLEACQNDLDRTVLVKAYLQAPRNQEKFSWYVLNQLFANRVLLKNMDRHSQMGKSAPTLPVCVERREPELATVDKKSKSLYKPSQKRNRSKEASQFEENDLPALSTPDTKKKKSKFSRKLSQKRDKSKLASSSNRKKEKKLTFFHAHFGKIEESEKLEVVAGLSTTPKAKPDQALPQVSTDLADKHSIVRQSRNHLLMGSLQRTAFISDSEPSAGSKHGNKY